MHVGHGRTNLHWRPHFAHKTFSRQILKFKQRTNVPYPYHHTKDVPYQRSVPVPLQKKRTVPAYRSSWQKLRRTVPYRTAILGRNHSRAFSNFPKSKLGLYNLRFHKIRNLLDFNLNTFRNVQDLLFQRSETGQSRFNATWNNAYNEFICNVKWNFPSGRRHLEQHCK